MNKQLFQGLESEIAGFSRHWKKSAGFFPRLGKIREKISKPWNIAAVCALLLQSALAAEAASSGAAVLLRLDRGAWAGAEDYPLGVGVPLKEGQVTDPRCVSIVSQTRGALPVACEARTRYPDGSVQWLWADFCGPAEESFSLVPTVAVPPAQPGVTVEQSPQSVTVDTGALRVTWNKSFATPVRVENCAADGARKLLAAGDGTGIFLLDEQGRRAVLGGAASELELRVETANPLRVVLRLEGWYVRGGTEQVARAVVRYHLYRNQPWLRIEHSFVVTRENDELSYREIAVRLPLQPGVSGRALFGIKEAPPVAVPLDDRAREAFVFQSHYPLYYKTNLECRVGCDGRTSATGREAEGWCDLHTGAAGLVLAVRDFAQQFPIELAADAGGVTARLWSGRDGRVLDYRPATLAREWWGDWLARVDKISAASVGGPPLHPDEVRAFNPSGIGVARTHELLVGYYRGPQDAARARRWHARLQAPPLVFPDPRWTCHVDARTFWPMAAAGEGGAACADVEQFIAAWFDEFMVPLQVFPYTGWYDFGKNPELRYVKEPLEHDRMYAQWWRVAFNDPYQMTKHLMLGWARSGDRRYLDAVHRFNRWIVDNKIIHWAGGKEHKRSGYFATGDARRLPCWYSGAGSLGCGGEAEFVTGPALEYLFCDNRWNRDTLELTRQALLKDFQPTPAFLRQAPDMCISYMTSLQRIHPDAGLKRCLTATFNAITDPATPTGLNEKFFNALGGHYTADYKINRKAQALVEYADACGDERARQIAAKAALLAGTVPQAQQVCYYCELYGASNARVFEWTRDPRLLEPLRRQVTGVQQLFAAYQRLPAGEKLRAHFVRQTPTNPLTDASPHSHYYFKETGLRDAQGQPLCLAFETAASAVPFLALPTAIWTLQQADAEKKSAP